MKLTDFGYDLPEELIAQFPLKKRDEARLLVVRRSDGTITHDIFKNLEKYLPAQSHLVFNESKVIPARLLGRRQFGTAEAEIFLLKALEDGYSYEVLMRPQKRLKVGEKIFFDSSKTYAEIIDKEKRIVRFNRKNIKF
jgi:S-adenosylmethionine:tRNA ribosyltransferase-isomerase